MKGSWQAVLLLSLVPGVLLAAEPERSGADAAASAAVSADAAVTDTATAQAGSAKGLGSALPSPGARTLVEKLRDQGERKRDPAPSVTTMLGGLAMTLGLLFALAWVARRLKLNVPGMAQGMRLDSMVALGPREKLCVVTRGDKVYVLGVTQHTITLIDSEAAAPGQEPLPDTQFSDRIKKLLQNGAPHGN